MSPDLDRKIMVLALAQNADPTDADSVISQALEGLHAEAQVLLDWIERLKVHGTVDESTVLAYSHIHRLEALDLLFSYHMSASWNTSRQPRGAQ
jgi:hypothetical protein